MYYIVQTFRKMNSLAMMKHEEFEYIYVHVLFINQRKVWDQKLGSVDIPKCLKHSITYQTREATKPKEQMPIQDALRPFLHVELSSLFSLIETHSLI